LLSAASASVSGLEDRREAADTDAERADIDKQLQELRLGIENLSDTVDRLEIQRERLARWYDVGDVGSRDREQFEGTRDFLAELATTVPEDTDIDREMDTERVMDMIQTVTSAVASVVTVTDPGEDTVAEAESLLDDPEL